MNLEAAVRAVMGMDDEDAVNTDAIDTLSAKDQLRAAQHAAQEWSGLHGVSEKKQVTQMLYAQEDLDGRVERVIAPAAGIEVVTSEATRMRAILSKARAEISEGHGTKSSHKLKNVVAALTKGCKTARTGKNMVMGMKERSIERRFKELLEESLSEASTEEELVEALFQVLPALQRMIAEQPDSRDALFLEVKEACSHLQEILLKLQTLSKEYDQKLMLTNELVQRCTARARQSLRRHPNAIKEHAHKALVDLVEVRKEHFKLKEQFAQWGVDMNFEHGPEDPAGLEKMLWLANLAKCFKEANSSMQGLEADITELKAKMLKERGELPPSEVDHAADLNQRKSIVDRKSIAAGMPGVDRKSHHSGNAGMPAHPQQPDGSARDQRSLNKARKTAFGSGSGRWDQDSVMKSGDHMSSEDALASAGQLANQGSSFPKAQRKTVAPSRITTLNNATLTGVLLPVGASSSGPGALHERFNDRMDKDTSPLSRFRKERLGKDGFAASELTEYVMPPIGDSDSDSRDSLGRIRQELRQDSDSLAKGFKGLSNLLPQAGNSASLLDFSGARGRAIEANTLAARPTIAAKHANTLPLLPSLEANQGVMGTAGSSKVPSMPLSGKWKAPLEAQGVESWLEERLQKNVNLPSVTPGSVRMLAPASPKNSLGASPLSAIDENSAKDESKTFLPQVSAAQSGRTDGLQGRTGFLDSDTTDGHSSDFIADLEEVMTDAKLEESMKESVRKAAAAQGVPSLYVLYGSFDNVADGARLYGSPRARFWQALYKKVAEKSKQQSDGSNYFLELDEVFRDAKLEESLQDHIRKEAAAQGISSLLSMHSAFVNFADAAQLTGSPRKRFWKALSRKVDGREQAHISGLEEVCREANLDESSRESMRKAAAAIGISSLYGMHGSFATIADGAKLNGSARARLKKALSRKVVEMSKMQSDGMNPNGLGSLTCTNSFRPGDTASPGPGNRSVSVISKCSSGSGFRRTCQLWKNKSAIVSAVPTTERISSHLRFIC